MKKEHPYVSAMKTMLPAIGIAILFVVGSGSNIFKGADIEESRIDRIRYGGDMKTYENDVFFITVNFRRDDKKHLVIKTKESGIPVFYCKPWKGNLQDAWKCDFEEVIQDDNQKRRILRRLYTVTDQVYEDYLVRESERKKREKEQLTKDLGSEPDDNSQRRPTP